MQPERLLFIFERSPEEAQLQGVDEVIRALGQNDMDVKVAAQARNDAGLIGSVLRFWFPYLWHAGVVGVSPGAALGSGAGVGEFVVTLAPLPNPVIGGVLGSWLQTRRGRKLRVKTDDVEMQAQTPEQVEALLSRLETLQRSRERARAEES